MSVHHFLALERRDDTLIVSVLRNLGCFSHDDFQDEWTDLLQRLEDPGIVRVVLDFRHVAYFGSILLELALQLNRRLQPRGGQVILSNLSTFGAEIVRLARFDQFCTIEESRH